jgi:hypothetical protein
MGELSNRDFALNLGGTLIASRTEDGKIKPTLRVVFKIEADLSKEANSAEVSIYNLRESTRGLLSRKGIRTTLEAGYAGRPHLIFAGKLDYGATDRRGNDWISEFESTDGAAEVRKSRINVSYKTVRIREAVKAAADAMGLGIGNVEEKIAQGNLRGALTEFAGGLVMSGQAAPQLDKLVKSFGFEWSIQNEEIILLEPGGVVDPQNVIVLQQSSGLIGSPQAGDDGTVEARSLMIPSLRPGRKVQIKSRLVDGLFRVERSVFLGDTWGQDWYTDIEAKPL